jgi:ketosteroid isomerase-like protein
MTSPEQTNRAFLENLFALLAEEGWSTSFLAALADDVTFNAMGRSPIAGRYQGKENYKSEVLDKLHHRLATRPQIELQRILTEGDMACLQFKSRGGRGVNGADFSIDYSWLLRIAEDGIKEIWGYYDTGKMIDLFKDDSSTAPIPPLGPAAGERGHPVARS